MRRAIARVAVVLAGGVALVGPARAEWSALQRLRGGLAECDAPRDERCGGLARADVDLDGLRLSHAWHERRGFHAEAEEVTIGLGWDGVLVDARGLQVSRPPTPARPTGPRVSPGALTRSDDAETSPARTRSRLDTYGIPVTIRAHGATTWTHGGVTLTLDAPELALDGHGGATATFGLRAEGPGLDVAGLDRWTAQAIDGDPTRWAAEGALRLADGPPTHASITLADRRVDALLRDPGGGYLQARAPLPRPGHGRPDTLSLHAEGFSVAALGHMGARTLAAWGIDSHAAMVDGSLRLDAPTTSRTGSLTVDRLHLAGVVVSDRKLARNPVELDGLELRGTLSWQGDDLRGELWMAHRDAEMTLSVSLDDEDLRLRADLAPLPCQALIGSLPDAMADMVSGTELSGRIEAHADLHVDRLALARDRADEDRASDAPPPGSLEVSFPFLEQCTFVHDDPRLDLSALSGPYRHRFVDDRGRHRERLMARGGPGYAALHEVPLLARAFVTLEDRRFWSHDGFDREQIGNAFWHNLVQGRVRRGASTISQQTARNLWLGVDRSWGRKLQEALLTVRLESSTSKDRIMELYLNVIELGPGVHGVQDAAKLYFGKPASELSVVQAIHLAMHAPAPARYANEHIDGTVSAEWRARIDDHVRRMYRAGYITREQMIGALRDDLHLLDRRG